MAVYSSQVFYSKSKQLLSSNRYIQIQQQSTMFTSQNVASFNVAPHSVHVTMPQCINDQEM